MTKNYTMELQRLQNILVGQIIDNHTIWYFVVSIILAYVFTSSPRILKARVKIYTVLLCDAVVELSYLLNSEFPKDVSILRRDVLFARQCSWTIAAFILVWDSVSNKEPNDKDQHDSTDGSHDVLNGDKAVTSSNRHLGERDIDEELNTLKRHLSTTLQSGEVRLSQEQIHKIVDLLVDISKDLRDENKTLHRKIEMLEHGIDRQNGSGT
ncbi:uncharacterized protein LOC144441163 [Glandiceps talaboti]